MKIDESAGNSSRSAKKAKPRGKPFKKGQSGNPLGRKPIPAELKKLLDEVSVEAYEKKVEIMRNPETPPQLVDKIASDIIDRVLGKAPQSIDLQSDNKHEIRVVLEGALKEWAK